MKNERFSGLTILRGFDDLRGLERLRDLSRVILDQVISLILLQV